jgi:hypothetical protein
MIQEQFFVVEQNRNDTFKLNLKNFVPKKKFDQIKKLLADNLIKYSNGFILNAYPSESIVSEISDLLGEAKAEAKQKRIETEKELKELYTNFLSKKTLKEIIGIFPNFEMVHRYSLTNSIIVCEQAMIRDMKQYVGILNSFENWKKLGYFVLKGEKGLAIRVPAPKKINEKDEDAGEEKESFVMHFKIGTTFDVSQTSAYEEYLEKEKSMKEKFYANYDVDYGKAESYIKERFPEVQITFNPSSDHSYYLLEDRSIILNEQKSRCLFHEIGHHITRKKLTLNIEDHARREILSEIASYLFTKKFDSNLNYNFSYSNYWSNLLPADYPIKDFENDFNALATYIYNL